MKLKYSPCKWNPNASHAAGVLPDTTVDVIDENSIRIDGETYEFDADAVAWNDVYAQSGGVILGAARDSDGTLCLTVRRYYAGGRPSWDDGEWHTLTAGEKA